MDPGGFFPAAKDKKDKVIAPKGCSTSMPGCKGPVFLNKALTQTGKKA